MSRLRIIKLKKIKKKELRWVPLTWKLYRGRTLVGEVGRSLCYGKPWYLWNYGGFIYFKTKKELIESAKKGHSK